MRADVKLGVVISVVLVSIAGGYYAFRGEREKPIQVDPLARKTAKLPQRATPKPATNNRSTKRNRTPSRNPARGSRPASRADRRKAAAPNKSQPVATRRRGTTPGGTTTTSRSRAAGTRHAGGAPKPPLNQPTSIAPVHANQPFGNSGKAGQPKSAKRPARTRQALADGSRPTSGSVTKGGTSPSSGWRSSTSLAAPVVKPTKRPSRSSAASSNSAVDRHRVQAGDTMVALAERYYGTSALATFLTKSNPQLAGVSKLQPGQIVQIPPRPTNATTKPSASTPPVTRTVSAKKSFKRYRVRPGDSFYKIAGTQLGNSSRWHELYELNKMQVGDDPSRLKVGQLLTLPGK